MQSAPILSITQKLSSQTSARLDKEIQVILWLLCPRDHHEWVALQEGPDAGGRHPDIDVLPSFHLKRLPTLNLEPDRTIYVRDVGLPTARPEETILVEDGTALDNAHEQKQPR